VRGRQTYNDACGPEIWGQDGSAQSRPWPAKPIHQGLDVVGVVGGWVSLGARRCFTQAGPQINMKQQENYMSTKANGYLYFWFSCNMSNSFECKCLWHLFKLERKHFSALFFFNSKSALSSLVSQPIWSHSKMDFTISNLSMTKLGPLPTSKVFRAKT